LGVADPAACLEIAKCTVVFTVVPFTTRCPGMGAPAKFRLPAAWQRALFLFVVFGRFILSNGLPSQKFYKERPSPDRLILILALRRPKVFVSSSLFLMPDWGKWFLVFVSQEVTAVKFFR
jgi:hypothetical protein